MHPPGSDRFLKMIVAHPDSDALRLAFADWLEEQGHGPRAAYIRLQIERHHPNNRSKDTNAINARIRKLEQETPYPLHGMPTLPGITWDGCSRGLVNAVKVTDSRELLIHSDIVLDLSPIRFLTLVGARQEDTAPLAALAGFAQLQLLMLHDTAGWDAVAWQTFAQCPHLGGLRLLIIDDAQPPELPPLTLPEVTAMLAGPCFRNVETLNVYRLVPPAAEQLLRDTLGSRVSIGRGFTSVSIQ